MSEKKKLPIGVSNFQKIIKYDYYFIDKSLLIKEIIEDGSKITLFSRPRLFGKTLNMNMLKCFFERQPDGSNNCELFRDLKIWGESNCQAYCGRYPVIFLTFKDIKMTNYAEAIEKIKQIINDLVLFHDYLLSSEVIYPMEKTFLEKFLNGKATEVDYENSLKNLTKYLSRYHKANPYIIIDEYDTPTQSAYQYGYFEKNMPFIQNLLCGGLKDNIYLEKGILTGILQVTNENIFSGLNNLAIDTISNERYSSYFGFTEEETTLILSEYQLEARREEIARWYNGYLFGSNVIYNPWSLINAVYNRNEPLKPYWGNISSNDFIYELITRGGAELKSDLENLLQGKTIEKPIVENIVYRNIEKNSTKIWSLLLFSGYLKRVGERIKNHQIFYQLRIPNEEVLYLYEKIITHWFNESICNDKYKLLTKSLINNDIKTFEKTLKEFVVKTYNYFDPTGEESEKVYHAFVLGLLISLNNQYEIKSNQESGYGRYDVMIIPRSAAGKTGYIFEFKKVEPSEGEDLEKCVIAALEQINTKAYALELKKRDVAKILEIGVAFEGKNVLLKWQENGISIK